MRNTGFTAMHLTPSRQELEHEARMLESGQDQQDL